MHFPVRMNAPLLSRNELRQEDRIRVATGSQGIQRLQAELHGSAFSPHRHDTYAVGITLSGVQTFRYRGEQRHCLPGQCHILHPDETHDGAAGTDEGFSYRIVYVDPGLIHDALGGGPLPFAREPVRDQADLRSGIASLIWDFDAEWDETAGSELVEALAELLRRACGRAAPERRSPTSSGVARARDLLASSPTERHSLEDLEAVAGLDRWTLTRQFRLAYGTSPSRFRTLRQLDHVRGRLGGGASLAEASLDAGFADQSHMTRHFKRAYGLTPGAWLAAMRRGERVSREVA
ncbi:AraC family ligand binding domain-containing protein [Enterovirga sp. CN4-39]|uniref:AraC family transcriptional regulator n=1 Tax=Enterovirga sp. CN4-39 TaxID=3400910 RepID=UPI003C018DB7